MLLINTWLVDSIRTFDVSCQETRKSFGLQMMISVVMSAWLESRLITGVVCGKTRAGMRENEKEEMTELSRSSLFLTITETL